MLIILVNTKLIPRQGDGLGAGTPDRLDRIKSILLWMKRTIGNLIEFVLSNKLPHERNFFNFKILKVVIHSVILLLLLLLLYSYQST